MAELSTRQRKVVEEAARRMQDKPWFRGVCLDNVPTDRSIDVEGFEKAVQDVVFDTMYWDSPMMGAKA